MVESPLVSEQPFDVELLFEIGVPSSILRERVMTYLGTGGTGSHLIQLIAQHRVSGIAAHTTRLLDAVSDVILAQDQGGDTE